MHFLQKIFLNIFSAFIAIIPAFGSVYQAETADLYKAIVETKNGGFLGDSYINFDNEPGSYLELRIGLLNTGTQEVKIRFANGSSTSRPMQISLNGEEIIASLVFEPTGSWTQWDTLTIQANFKAGINLLRLTSTGSEGGPNIDQLEVSGEQLPSYTLNLSLAGTGTVIQIPDKGLLFEGQKLILIAYPGVGNEFKEWMGDASGNSDTLELLMNSDKTLTAIFEEINIEIPEPQFSMIGYATIGGEGLETTTGGADGNIVVIETLQELITWGASREDNYTPEIIIIKGKIEADPTEVITIKRGGNISILGDSGTIEGFAEMINVSLNISDYSNVIVRNLKMHEVYYPDDDLTIDHCHHVWIDHCEFHSKIGAGIGMDTYDGLLDIKNGSHNITVSWCYFHDHMKTMLMGHSDDNGEMDVDLQATLHHNWFSNTDGRNPSLRFGQVHYFNNFLESITDYGFAVRNGAHAKIENCHFESVYQPIVTDKFEGHGYACVSGCIYSGSCSPSDNQISEPTGCDFWMDQIPYEYSLEDINSVALSVKKYSGVGKLDPTKPITTTLTKNAYPQVLNVYFIKAENYIDINFTAQSSQQCQVSLYSINGSLIISEKKNCQVGTNNLKMQLNSFYPGVYILDLQSSGFRLNKKIFLY
jgi:pectate lyase